MKRPQLTPTFLDRLLDRDPLHGLVADLGRLLNARQAAAGAPDLSIIDRLDLADQDDRARLARRVAAIIRQHDPRLSRVQVRADLDEGQRIHLHVVLQLSDLIPRVRIDAVHSAGRWRVTSTGAPQ